MADSVVDKKSNFIEDDQLPCSSSSLSPVNNVLTDTSNLHDKSKLLLKDESSVQKIKHMENESSTPSNEKKKDFEIGDIVWAKLGSYPFWPSMVCIDPETNVYIKGSLENKKQFSLHVRFCNDHGRRSWAKTIEMYSGKEDFLSKYPNGLAFLKNSKKQMEAWETAVKEADNWLKVNNRDERMATFSRRNGLFRSKISGLGPKTTNTLKTRKAPTPSTSTEDSYTPQEFLDLQKALRASRQPSTSGSQGIKCEASTSGPKLLPYEIEYVTIDPLKEYPLNVEERTVVLEKPEVHLSEIFAPKPRPAKKKYVDVKQKKLREELKVKRAKRRLQIKKYGFSYSSSEYESTDEEAEPLVPFNPNRKVLQSIKYAVENLESEGRQKEKQRRILIKAIRLAERRKSKKNKEEEEEEEEEKKPEQEQ